MGYRSDVYIAVAFDSKKRMDEVMAVYALNTDVQKHNLVNDWVIKDDNILYFHVDNVKWYDDYEWVQGYKHMFELLKKFYEARGFSSAYRLVRIGEEREDVEDESDWFDGVDIKIQPMLAWRDKHPDTTLIDKLTNGMRFTVEVTL
tara:strand:- start:821 stop:1258 length:438 start_codon:yes stop_codon:yes gene_type:complete